ncbi:aldo/keto reductase [Streptomyces sp. RKND-216]|uniref:aldo/keto reductase n=1 Tax=Streptomyces sp. RKND-216 TaxID=2562581 RepID=UPI001FFBE8DD|nr:aldo/keto reductase [Streptomyces sp. RKND-216]
MADRPGHLRPADPDAVRAVARRAVETGVQLVDTADCYGPEISETLISEALTPYRDHVAVSTKGGRRALGGGSWQADGTRRPPPRSRWPGCCGGPR